MRNVAIKFSHHSLKRMNSRRISQNDVQDVVQFGRIFHARGASIYVFGDREVSHLNLPVQRNDALNGLQIITNPKTGEVITVYRNADFNKIRKTDYYKGKAV